MLTFSWVDYMLFCLMFGISALIGIYHGCFGNKQATTKDYLFGGKNMKYIPVAISMGASTLSGISLLGIPAEVYIYGTQFWMTAGSLVLMGFINNYIFLPVFYNLQLNSTYEYLEIRFDKRVSKLASVLFAISTFLYLPIVIFAPSLAFNQVTGFNINYIAPIMAIICIFYTTIGGFKTVIWTDTLQFTVTLCTLFFVLIMGTISVGGVSSIWDTAGKGDRIEFFNMDPDPTLRITFWSVILGQTSLWVAYIGVHPAGVQRFLATPTLTHAKKTLILFVVISIVTKSIGCFSGLIMYAKYANCDPLTEGKIKRADQILPYYVMDVSSQIPGLSGLFFAGIFSTALSTLSTYLNSLSGMIYTDFILPFMPADISQQRASNIIKLITVAIGLISLVISIFAGKLGSVIEVWMSLTGITSGPLVGLFTLGMLVPFVDSKGALSGGIVSLLFMSWMIIKANMYIKSGGIKYTRKPLDITGCSLNLNDTILSTAVPSEISTSLSTDDPFWLFKVTFNYYTLVGILITVIVAVCVNWVTRKHKNIVDKNLLSPCIHRFISSDVPSSEYQSVETNLHILSKINGKPTV